MVPIYFDTECYPNFWLFKCVDELGNWGKVRVTPDKPLTHAEQQWLVALTQKCELNGFNSNNYDILMVRAAIAGANNATLKALNDAIIVGGLKRWEMRSTAWPQWQGPINSIDIMEVVPGVKIGLKTYMARMHSPNLQDLPYPPDTVLTPEQMDEVDNYCGNDILGTRELVRRCHKRLALRREIGARYGIDLRSKSDAQMSEAIIAARLGYRPEQRYIPSGYKFSLTPAHWLNFVTPYMQDVFAKVCGAEFVFNRKDPGEELPDGTKSGVTMPDVLKKMRVQLPGADTVYKFGIGGLHSMETGRDLQMPMTDSDVASFYPFLIILLRLIDPTLLQIYESIVKERITAKKAGDSVTESGLKIVINGFFGKLWSKYSYLLDPAAGVNTTINGQLSLLMLIERLHIAGITTLSANTDGIVTYCPPHLRPVWHSTMAWWQKTTGLTLEHKAYARLVQRDVNNYIAIGADGSVKLKGVFAESGLLAGMQGIHPDRDICKIAAVQFVTKGTPLLQTIAECQDITKFLCNRKVKGGAWWQGGYLGPTARWYYAKGGAPITNGAGNKVAASDGARPLQRLPLGMPDDVDYALYLDFAKKLLTDCGVNISAA